MIDWNPWWWLEPWVVWGSSNEQLFVDIVCAQRPPDFGDGTRIFPFDEIAKHVRNLGFFPFLVGENVPPMRFACSATSGNRCRFSCFLGEQGADPMDLMLPKPSEVCWKREKATRTQKLPLSFGCRDFEIIHRNSQRNEPGFLNPDFHVEDVFVLFISDVFFFFVGPTVTVSHVFFVGSPCFCWQRERRKRNTQIPPKKGMFKEKRKTADVPGTNEGEKTPKLGNIRINEAKRPLMVQNPLHQLIWYLNI